MKCGYGEVLVDIILAADVRCLHVSDQEVVIGTARLLGHPLEGMVVGAAQLMMTIMIRLILYQTKTQDLALQLL